MGGARLCCRRNKPCPLLSLDRPGSCVPNLIRDFAMAEGKVNSYYLYIYILLASIANITLHSTEDGWRGPDSKRCRQSTGGATTSTEPVLRTGPEAESKATRSREHPRDRFRAAQTPSSDRVGVSEQSTAKTNLEIHCRCSQKSCSQSSSASNGCGGSSLS